jgi:hypothetical protein
VLSDRSLTERQKQVLLDVYQSFRRENDQQAVPTPTHATTSEE